MVGLSIIALTRQAAGCKHRVRLVLLLTLTLLAGQRVAPTGPGQIEHYRELDYDLIVMDLLD